MKMIKILMLSSILALASCTTDPCVDVTCLNGGICDDGTCMCVDWYEGTDCSTEERAKYYGSYIGTATYFNEDGNLIDSSIDTIPVMGNGSIVNELNADKVILALVASGMGDFEIPTNTMSDPDGTSFIINGDGSFNGNLLTINAKLEFTTETLDFSFSGSK
jgi:hypothetical protein